MKLGIIGLPGSGKRTIFSALTGARGEQTEGKGTRGDQRIGTVRVTDERVNFLKEIFEPKKTAYAQVEYVLPSGMAAGAPSKSDNIIWTQARVCDGLIHVLRNFQAPAGPLPAPEGDFRRLEEEMILNDLVVAEKRIDRIELDIRKGDKSHEEELLLLRSCKDLLESGKPLRADSKLACAPGLRGFTFLTAKSQLLLMNNDDEDEQLPAFRERPEDLEMLLVRGRLEMEIAAMAEEDAREFREAYGIDASALDRVIRGSYRILNLISFFTVLNEEVRVWTIREGTPALEAAGTVHSDMQKGFIRAEVLSFAHLKEYGSFHEAKKAGVVRLEGKWYPVQDGDIIHFRFNV
jgi:GTP-binding protein YchF